MDVMGVSMLEGRDFDDRDTLDRDLVAIVNDRAAQEFWPNQNAIG